MSLHSSIGASSMHRWQNCPGSVRLSQGLAPTTNAYAEAGTKAHEVSASILRREPYTFPADLDLAAIQSYVEIIQHERKTSTTFWIEKSFEAPSLHEGFFGTSDAGGYWAEEKLLRIYDFKYGSGHFVPVEQNPQLLYYALGAALSFETVDLEIDHVELAIIQPRCPRKGKIDHRWKAPYPFVLIDFALTFLEAAKNTEDPKAPLVEGAWCFFCPAVTFCPAQHKKRNERARNQFSDEEAA